MSINAPIGPINDPDAEGPPESPEAEIARLRADNAILRARIRKLEDCPGCDGRGERWYALYGQGKCLECGGSGKRQGV